MLAVDDAAAFLLERTKGRRRAQADDHAKAREIAEELGRLALALEQAAAFISKRRLTFAQYPEQWRAQRDDVLKWWDITVTDYPRSVAVTWQTSVAQLSEDGRRLLERLAWLAPEKMPESLLDVPVPGAENENLHDAYDDLAAYSLVTRDAEGPFFLVRRLVQDVTRRSLVGEARQRSMTEALHWLDAAFAENPADVRNWPTLDPLAPHARSVTAHTDNGGIATPTARLMNNLKALHAEAEPLYRRALAIDEKSFGPDHPEVATDLNNLAGLLRATNRLAAAEPLMRRHVAIFVEFTRQTGHRHPYLDAAFRNYAGLLADMGKSEAQIDAACAALMRPLADSSAPARSAEDGGGEGAGGEG